MKNIDIRRFLGYVCHIAKVRVRMSFGWVSLFAQKFVFFYFFVRMRISLYRGNELAILRVLESQKSPFTTKIAGQFPC